MSPPSVPASTKSVNVPPTSIPSRYRPFKADRPDKGQFVGSAECKGFRDSLEAYSIISGATPGCPPSRIAANVNDSCYSIDETGSISTPRMQIAPARLTLRHSLHLKFSRWDQKQCGLRRHFLIGENAALPMGIGYQRSRSQRRPRTSVCCRHFSCSDEILEQNKCTLAQRPRGRRRSVTPSKWTRDWPSGSNCRTAL